MDFLFQGNRYFVKMPLERLFTCAQHLNCENLRKDLLRCPWRLSLTRVQYWWTLSTAPKWDLGYCPRTSSSQEENSVNPASLTGKVEILNLPVSSHTCSGHHGNAAFFEWLTDTWYGCAIAPWERHGPAECTHSAQSLPTAGAAAINSMVCMP